MLLIVCIFKQSLFFLYKKDKKNCVQHFYSGLCFCFLYIYNLDPNVYIVKFCAFSTNSLKGFILIMEGYMTLQSQLCKQIVNK